MIEVLVKKFDVIEKDVNLLTGTLVGLLLVIVSRGAYLAYIRDFDSMWGLLGPFSSVAAASLVSRLASRLIVHGQILREDDKRRELLRITHQLLAVTKDLQAKMGYFTKLMADGDKPIAVMVSLVRSIEKRYEALYDKDAYQFLPGPTIDLINDLSGSISGMLATSEILAGRNSDGSRLIKEITGKTSDEFNARNSKIWDEVQALIDQIYELRASLDASRNRTP